MHAADTTRSSPAPSLAKGQTLFGYEVLQRIGHGSASTVYMVRPVEGQGQGQARFALKHVLSAQDPHHHVVDQLKNELEVSQHLNHPGLRRCVDLKLRHTLLRRVSEAALVMELADGLSLHDRPLAGIPGIVACFIKAARAVEAMHKAGYVHCGLRPHELLMDSSGDVKVIDYGQAVKVGAVVRPREGQEGAAQSPPPELAGREPVTPRADVFGLGASLYEVLCRKPLPPVFTQQTSETSFRVRQEVPSPHAVDERVPQTLSDLVMQCVRGNPLKRPADMAELAWRLEVIHHGLVRSAAPAGQGPAMEFSEPEDEM